MNPDLTHRPHPTLPPDELRKYRGKWVAICTDDNRVIASADDLENLEDRLTAIGEDPEKVLFDRIEDENTLTLGGAELL